MTAQLHGFDAEFVEIVVRAGADSAFDRIPMIAAQDSGAFELLLFDVEQTADYYVESNGVRSPVYRIEVADLPYVQSLRLEYHFPAYTGLAPEVVEDGGDIAVLKGTVVKVFATPTIPVQTGRIVLDGDRTAALAAGEEGELVGSMKVEQDGFYHLELAGHDSAMVTASPQYTIDILSDLPPTVSFEKPGRDTRVTPIEEVFIEASAEDDFGVGSIDLVYSVNGGDEKTVRLFESTRPLPEATAGHTFYLEELGLEAGDIISYYARASDNNAAGNEKATTSDIYFLNVRAFEREYRQAEQAGGGGGGGGGGPENGELSERQREIVAATFNLQRDSTRYTAAEYGENMVTIALSQERLLEQTQTLAQRMTNRGVTEDSAFQKIAELLPQAVEEMTNAAERLRKAAAGEALPPEQRALQFLQRAEAVFREVQVQFGQQQGGGGGGGSPNAEDLADLFELELDKLRNQYETVQRGESEQAQNQVDETMERLRELARRQQQEAERMRRQAQASQGGGGGGQSQRELAEETEELARQLERLSREQSDP
ncbi:MAG: DUF4175 family protein, partial [Longimicrobiales bacterium]